MPVERIDLIGCACLVVVGLGIWLVAENQEISKISHQQTYFGKSTPISGRNVLKIGNPGSS
jgi:hypothetical protein